MSRGAGLGLDRNHERDFVLSSVEEFVKRFDGTRPINKVNEQQTHARTHALCYGAYAILWYLIRIRFHF